MNKTMRAMAVSLFVGMAMMISPVPMAYGQPISDVAILDDAQADTNGVLVPDETTPQPDVLVVGEDASANTSDVVASEDEPELVDSAEEGDVALSAMASGSDVRYSGTVGTCGWTIDYDGNLVIRPSNGSSGSFDPTNYRYSGYKAYSDYVESVSFEGIVKVTTCKELFNGFDVLSTACLQGLDASEVTSMEKMFDGCELLQSIDFSGIDTSLVTNMSHLLDGCSKLREVDLSPLDTSSVTTMSYLFCSCESLQAVDLAALNTSKVTDMSHLFYCCMGLQSINLSTLDTTHVVDMSSMFAFCKSLKSVDLSPLVTSETTDMGSMFYSCSELERVNLSSLDTSNVTDMSEMFQGCEKLEGIDLGGFNTRAVTNMDKFLYNCNNLKWFKLGPDFRFPKKNNYSALPYVSSRAPYRGLWAYESPLSNKTYSSYDLPSLYDGATMAGTYVWAEYPSIDQMQISLVSSLPYTGDELKPEPTVTYNGTTLEKGTDYELSYANNENVGTATVTITGKNKYPGKATGTFKIVRSANGVRLPKTLRVKCGDFEFLDTLAGSVKVVKWTTSNDTVAEVTSPWSDSVVIEGVWPGTAVITAIGGDGSKASCTVTTYATKPKLKINSIVYGASEVSGWVSVDEDLLYLYVGSPVTLKLDGREYKSRVGSDGSIVFNKVKHAKSGKTAVLSLTKYGMTSEATTKVGKDFR
ncbi:MAG: BspA family leucine-rich repeat surface protein, partial [Atopobiaceae bacterium]|nr:BspA family leucine-rich repeat surface protein [Atopobiaceae bacterium]